MDKIGKYDLVRELGRGATSTVYLGKDPFTQREVAVKVAFPDILKDPERGKLIHAPFLNEAALIGKTVAPAHRPDLRCRGRRPPLLHRHGVCGGRHAGNGLLTGRLLPIERVVEIIFKCTRALDFAFRAGITHRDIKPANILFSNADPSHGDIKISDFGAAIIGSPERTLVWASARPPTCRRNRCGNKRSITRPTSTRSASSCTSC
jgi:serine/threonine protein kinase